MPRANHGDHRADADSGLDHLTGLESDSRNFVPAKWTTVSGLVGGKDVMLLRSVTATDRMPLLPCPLGLPALTARARIRITQP